MANRPSRNANKPMKRTITLFLCFLIAPGCARIISRTKLEVEGVAAFLKSTLENGKRPIPESDLVEIQAQGCYKPAQYSKSA